MGEIDREIKRGERGENPPTTPLRRRLYVVSLSHPPSALLPCMLSIAFRYIRDLNSSVRSVYIDVVRSRRLKSLLFVLHPPLPCPLIHDNLPSPLYFPSYRPPPTNTFAEQFCVARNLTFCLVVFLLPVSEASKMESIAGLAEDLEEGVVRRFDPIGNGVDRVSKVELQGRGGENGLTIRRGRKRRRGILGF